MPTTNVDLQRKYRRDWYNRNKDIQLKRQNERRNELKKWFRSYKKQCICKDCGFDFKEHPECCDFHHIIPSEKKGTVYALIKSSKKAFLDELKKCVTLCANCHRIRHKDDLYENL